MADLGIPPGWTDLGLVLVHLEPSSVTMDCVVAGVRSIPPADATGPVRGHPVAVRIHAPADSAARDELETWLRSDPAVALLTDHEGSVLLLTLDERMIALELDRGA
ncbi:hypothetical protein [Dermatobacter hominis]|uniref:hypothetical protein n=1 Tax=Dermatobacter hominis TaxID=2884263 RepID=UPI001D0F6E6E|nr:hypothetical protein [Dermatobacter hominis]UDY37492.1 hypothetical protein LH044_08090 [Dermatobacter hominis]